MKKLYHYPICPLSRQVRILLKELDSPFTLIKEDYWLQHKKFLKLNPAGEVPVLEEPFGLIVCGIYPIIEYLHDKYPNFNFMDEEPNIRCEIRRVLSWVNEKFYRETTRIFIHEKVISLLTSKQVPRTEFLRIAKSYQNKHLQYISFLLEKRSFLASDILSCADIAAASHISVLDYFGEINWDLWPYIKQWYYILKSRPSFQPILHDIIPGFTPHANYTNLDF